MALNRACELASGFDEYLGNPFSNKSIHFFEKSVELDELEAYPEDICRHLNDWGFPLYFIPEQDGGRLSSFEELFMLVRILSRRDLTCTIAITKTFLGAVPVWLAGSVEQRRRVVEMIHNHQQISLALTEKNHGSDLLSGTVSAKKTPDGYCLNGEKWLINNATRGVALSVLARTNQNAGPRAFSMLLVDKEKISSKQYENLPAAKTHGIRGADISGIKFNDCVIPSDALVGDMGAGLELTLKAFHVTRTIVPALSLGAVDTALRTTLGFALSRRLYNKTVYDIPYVKLQLAEAFVDLLACECVSLTAVRSMHVIPEQMSSISAVAKYFVPSVAEDTLRSLAIVLGARHYLRQEHEGGIFQKILRDHSIVGVFDGNTAVNLDAISKQLPKLVGKFGQKYEDAIFNQTTVAANLEVIFDVRQSVDVFDATRLALTNHGRDDVMLGVISVVKGLQEQPQQDGLRSETVDRLLQLTNILLQKVRSLSMRVLELSSQSNNAAVETEFMELARQYCHLYSAASCLQMWWHNRLHLSRFFLRGEWLILVLARLLNDMDTDVTALSYSDLNRIVEELTNLYQEDKLFSIVSVELAQTYSEKPHEAVVA